jgi:23S rRNA pseudouridine2605 synthase
MPVTEPLRTRLNKLIADSGYCARRKADALIAAGRVCVNGEPVSQLGIKVCASVDTITIDGRPLPVSNKIYLLLHKPVGYLTSKRGTPRQETFYTLLPPGHAQCRPGWQAGL